jgi:hypothetical protein
VHPRANRTCRTAGAGSAPPRTRVLGTRAPPRSPGEGAGGYKMSSAFVAPPLRGAAVASAQSDRKRVRAAARGDLGERGRERGEVLGHEELGRWAPDERGGGPAKRSVPDW